MHVAHVAHQHVCLSTYTTIVDFKCIYSQEQRVSDLWPMFKYLKRRCQLLGFICFIYYYVLVTFRFTACSGVAGGQRAMDHNSKKIGRVGNKRSITGCLMNIVTKYRGYRDTCVGLPFPVIPFAKTFAHSTAEPGPISILYYILANIWYFIS